MKGFLKECQAIIETMAKMNIDHTINRLLWIYLNLLSYPQLEGRDDKGYREVFLAAMKNNNTFKELIALSNIIPQELYEMLENNILKGYSFFSTVAKDKEIISIKELESIYENLLQKEVRCKTGSYYTPEYIVEFITFSSLEAFIRRRSNITIEASRLRRDQIEISADEAQEIIDIIAEIKIIDIACGGGVFLRSALNILWKLKKAALAALGEAQEDYIIKSTIIKDNLYGIDLQASTVQLSRILMLMELYTPEMKELLDSPMNIAEGNALLLEGTELQGSYDIVIGNPPYLGERGNKEFFNWLKATPFGSKYYESKMDYFYYFIYKATELLKKGGILGYITTNYFVTADGAAKLRGFMRENFSFKAIVNFNDVNIFQDAKGQHNMIFIAMKETFRQVAGELIAFEKGRLSQEEIEAVLYKEKSHTGAVTSNISDQHLLYDYSGQILIQNEGGHGLIVEKLLKKATASLGELCNVNQGIVSGADRLTELLKRKIKEDIAVGNGIFVLTEEAARRKGFFSDEYRKFLKPFYKNSNVCKYSAKASPELYILYLTDNNIENIEDYPLLQQHLSPFRKILEGRREVKQGSISWYALQWPRSQRIFQEEKILAPQRALDNVFGYSKEDWYASADVYFISRRAEGVSLKYLLGILNSSIVYFWLYYRGKRKGDYLELYTTPLKAIPIAIADIKGRMELELLVEEILKGIRVGDDYRLLQEEIDRLIFKIYDLSLEEQKKITDFVNKRRRK